MQKYFIVKYNNNNNFLSGTIVKHCANTYNNCHLVEKINTNERIWLMNYEIYPIADHNIFNEWSYDNNFQKMIPSEYYIIINNNKVVKLLNINNNKYNVLDLYNNEKIIIDKEHLIKANEYKVNKIK